MPELGWIIAVAALVGLIVLGLLLRRRTAEAIAERLTWERRSKDDVASVRATAQAAASAVEERAREALEDAERRRGEMEAVLAGQRQELRETRAAQERRESRLHEREDRLSAEAEGLVARAERLDAQRIQLREQREELQAQEERLALELERVARLSVEEARKEVLAAAEKQAKLTATSIARDIEATAKREADQIARRVITTAIQRVASEQTSESVVSTVDLPSDDMKGRIIGREGRNIRAFEQITGVNVLIDDTPESVLLSSFDPVRRETARLTLVDLIADGRIHPARIEEVHERSLRRINDRVLRAGEDALAEVGIVDLHPDLVPIVGALAFRTSYGQNVLRHLVECAHLAGVMAAELGLNVTVCKRAAFLHDIGKALTHEVEGPHAIIGAELLRKYGEHEDIAHAVEAHHNEVEPRTVEAVLTQAADAISGSRPGARRESLEAYVERMENLEHIATKHEGVVRAYAMQAGREVRVMVSPDHIDDAGAHALARDIAAEVEKTLSYPGQIRITVVRESRATETAH
ncbi:ribonuclease Y [Tessaracoccus sp. ZS01]|uniref:ribonuclease Y n=1 Tax=Tessaracoccus sp. ZS01 TaxID=1906324 RepID=UPI00096F9106|nr:ribonuclease Y [Tessaracoccus sp. ZS01]MCG6566251.1 ribonuclease Y [Tessaracoccus sp. ZS01]OMG58729.1 ribonuclease Y [Tessaracoccus sp. ZS01]